jgi:hypothetical protein
MRLPERRVHRRRGGNVFVSSVRQSLHFHHPSCSSAIRLSFSILATNGRSLHRAMRLSVTFYNATSCSAACCCCCCCFSVAEHQSVRLQSTCTAGRARDFRSSPIVRFTARRVRSRLLPARNHGSRSSRGLLVRLCAPNDSELIRSPRDGLVILKAGSSIWIAQETISRHAPIVKYVRRPDISCYNSFYPSLSPYAPIAL